ncbi:hypothetical protein B0H19DRAFT_1231866 [Mycena capillaripes]|nr:hypothetical protein B0H19DRAFT_1231866 [Mycena capillaripes]
MSKMAQGKTTDEQAKLHGIPQRKSIRRPEATKQERDASTSGSGSFECRSLLGFPRWRGVCMKHGTRRGLAFNLNHSCFAAIGYRAAMQGGGRGKGARSRIDGGNRLHNNRGPQASYSSLPPLRRPPRILWTASASTLMAYRSTRCRPPRTRTSTALPLSTSSCFPIGAIRDSGQCPAIATRFRSGGRGHLEEWRFGGGAKEPKQQEAA